MNKLIEDQRSYFRSGETRTLKFRMTQLKRLRKVIEENTSSILQALKMDLRKPEYEAYASEIAFLYQEIDHALKNLKRWMKPKRVKTPLVFAPASSNVVPEPYGVTLIIGPWNYPFQLILAPLIGAIAAGNTSILKPSELAPHTSHVIAEIIDKTFSPSYIAVVEGGVETTQNLLEQKFDYIFFTGGTAVGKVIMKEAAQHLTPVTLELGGKSPVIVADDADINAAAKKIVWGKFINAGQTCLAPDFVLVQEAVRETLLERIVHYIRAFYGEDPQKSHYSRIINQRHFERLTKLMDRGHIVAGGETDASDLYIAPTVFEGISLDDPIMREEIFGPLLPVLSFQTIDEAVSMVNTFAKPLALYLFTGNRESQNRVIHETSSGGVCINDTIIHVGNYFLPFGGVGESGMGVYHGKDGFDTFSHLKSVFKKSWRWDLPFRYPPYRRSVAFLRKIFE
jgi:aldehyde dehydrogenase (NAD+)